MPGSEAGRQAEGVAGVMGCRMAVGMCFSLNHTKGKSIETASQLSGTSAGNVRQFERGA